jgi:ankyrin repeat protein
LKKFTKAVEQEMRKGFFSRIRGGEDDVVAEMVALGIDLDGEFKGNTALTLAASHANLLECKALVNAGANVNVANARGKTPLHCAVQREDAVLVQFLLESGADVHARDEYGCTAFADAVIFNSLPICEMLVGAGSRVDERNNSGYTPLHHAAMGCMGEEALETCQWLLGRGASPHSQTKFGNSALHWAALAGHVETCRVLVRSGASPSQPSTPTVDRKSSGPLLTPFQYAVSKGKTEIVRFFVKECGEDLAQRTENGRTLAQVALADAETRDLLRSLKTELAVSQSCSGMSEVREHYTARMPERTML